MICVLVMVALGSGCSGSRGGGETCSAGASALPSDSLQDWATYGDFLVEWQVDGERRLPPTPEESAAGEGTITRLVTMRSDHVLWKRPSASDRLSAPQTLEVASGGWEFHGKKEKPFEGLAPRLRVGQRYLAVLSFTDLSVMSSRPQGAEWIALTDVALTDERVVAPGAEVCSAQLKEVLAGRSASEVSALLAATPVDPAAKRYLDLDPVVRFQRAANDKIATSSYTPGPGPGEKE